MPIDFTFVLACRAPSLSGLFARVEQFLSTRGFTRSHEVLVSDSADPSHEPEDTLSIPDLADADYALQPWGSIYMDFRSPEASFGVQFDRAAGDEVNGFVFVSKRIMYRLHKSEIPAGFYDTLAGIATLAAAVGGYGGFEAAQTPLPPDKTLAALLVNPAQQDQWFDVHIVNATALAGSAAGRAWANDFERVERGGFVFFIQKAYLALCQTFGEAE